MKIILSTLLCAASFAHAALVTQVNFDSGSAAMYNNGGFGNPAQLLTPGSVADGDGAVIQLGYYDAAIASNNFAGTWHALTGIGSLNTGGNTGSGLAFTTTSIGDIGGGPAPGGSGIFAFQLQFSNGVANTFNDLPTSTLIPLAIKFFSGTATGTSTTSGFYNVVSNNNWLWKLPATPNPVPPTVNMSLSDTGLVWQSIAVAPTQPASSAFTTSISIAPVPEPSTLTFGALAALVAAGARRRRRD